MLRHPRRASARASLAYAELLESRALLSAGGTVPLPAGPGTDATVAGRYIFFNHSAYDGNDAAANASDDSAVSPAVVPLLPKQAASFSNVSNYSRGLNGVMVDVDHLASGALSADDFAFQTGNDAADPGGWAAAPGPSSITVRRGAGVNGSDRITLVWPDGAVGNAWIRVTVLDTPDTGLSAPDVFAFGSLPGDAGLAGSLPIDITDPTSGFTVGTRDLLATRRSLGRHRRVDVSSALDHNHDGRIDARDLLAVRQNLFSRLERVQSPAGPPVYYVSPGGDDAGDGLSPLSAWRTVGKVNAAALPPGAHVLFERGGEWHERLIISSSGTAQAPVVFGSYGSGTKPKFWGSDPVEPASFQPVDGADSTYRIVPTSPLTVNSVQADHAFFRSARLGSGRPTDAAAGIAFLRATPGTWFQDPATGALYVHTNGDDPRTGAVLYTASVRDNVVLVQRQHDVVVRNLVVDESASLNGGYAFGVGECANVTLEGCEAYRAGKHHFGAIDTDNFVGRDLYSAWAMPDQGYGNASAYVSYSGASLAATPTRSRWYDCTYVEAEATVAPYMSFYTHGAGMGDLLVENMRSTGGLGFVLATEGAHQNAVVRGGLIENGALTLYSNDALVEDVTVRGPSARVLLAGSRNTVQNVIVDGARLQAGAAGAVIDAGGDNTFRFSTVRVDPATDWPGVAVAIKTRSGKGIRLYGNIIDAPRAIAVDPEVGPGVTFTSDHNLFAHEPQFVFPDYSLHTLAEWRAQYGQDASSVVADPLFADAAAGDLRLGAGSPAVDAFVATDLLAGIPADALGLPRPQGAAYDLGALERRA